MRHDRFRPVQDTPRASVPTLQLGRGVVFVPPWLVVPRFLLSRQRESHHAFSLIQESNSVSHVTIHQSTRVGSGGTAGASLSHCLASARDHDPKWPAPQRRTRESGRQTFEFILRCRRDDGSYAPSPDTGYAGESDTKLSDLAAVTYAAVLAKTMGWELPEPKRSAQFIARHQREDGRFVNQGGEHDADSALGVLYNTTQGVVALRALGERPRIDPTPVIDQLARWRGVQEAALVHHQLLPTLVCGSRQAVSRRVAAETHTAHGSEPGRRRLSWRSRRGDLSHGPFLSLDRPTHAEGRPHGGAGAPRSETRWRLEHQAARLGRPLLLRRGLHSPPAWRRRSQGQGGDQQGRRLGRLDAATATAASAISPAVTPTWTPSTSSSAP